MADLSVLIRLHKHELDEKRRALGALYEAMSALERQKRDMDRTLQEEKERLSQAGEAGFTFAAYAAAMRKKREEVERREAELERQIEAAKESLMETFSELKKYEMTQEERLRLEEEERAFREARTMDEIGLEGFRRRGEAEE